MRGSSQRRPGIRTLPSDASLRTSQSTVARSHLLSSYVVDEDRCRPTIGIPFRRRMR
jgi:hypothetical protein